MADHRFIFGTFKVESRLNMVAEPSRSAGEIKSEIQAQNRINLYMNLFHMLNLLQLPDQAR